MPPLPPGFSSISQVVTQTTQPPTVEISGANMTSLTTSASSSTSTSNSTNASSVAITWKEVDWTSGEIVLARQKLTGIAGLTYDGICANLLNNVQTLISELEVPRDRAVFRDRVTVVNNAADWGTVQTALESTDPQVTAFYWYGHGSADRNSIGGYVTAKTLSTNFGNYYFATNTAGKPSPKIVTYLPFSFVFLDGCRTAKGMLPEAFGIPKDIAASNYTLHNKHKRAFMGWNGRVTASILERV
jgi:hypothetical protein